MSAHSEHVPNRLLSMTASSSTDSSGNSVSKFVNGLRQRIRDARDSRQGSSAENGPVGSSSDHEESMNPPDSSVHTPDVGGSEDQDPYLGDGSEAGSISEMAADSVDPDIVCLLNSQPPAHADLD